MSNPYFSNSAVFGGKADKDVQRTNAQMDPRFAATTSAQYGATDAASLDSMYNSPAATTADTGRMTYDDVIMKTGACSRFSCCLVQPPGSWHPSCSSLALLSGSFSVWSTPSRKSPARF